MQKTLDLLFFIHFIAKNFLLFRDLNKSVVGTSKINIVAKNINNLKLVIII